MNLFKNLSTIWSKNTFKNGYKSTTNFIRRRPFTSFFLSLCALFLIIVIGNYLTRPKIQPPITNGPKTVGVYTIGEAPKATFQAKVDKKGVIKIVALSGGIIQDILVSEGDTVYQGQQLATLSTNYQGGNASALASQIADTQYKNTIDTFPEQQSIIQKQRDLANINHDNFSDQQKIATQSANDTNNLINSNQLLLDQLNHQLTNDKQNNAPSSTIGPEESQINQLQAGQNQLRTALSNLQEQTDSSKPAGRLADAQHDLTLQQLNIQEKSLELGKELAKLSSNIADVNAATMYPASPFAAVVQRIYIRIGQQVNPGTPIMEISSTNTNASLLVDVTQQIAQHLSPLDTSTVTIGTASSELRPLFIPKEPSNGSLFTITYPLSESMSNNVTDGQYMSIAIPVGHADTSSSVPFVPLDAIYQTQNSSYVVINENGKAVSRNVVIGEVFGNYVEITHGLLSGDRVVIDRTVLIGDSLKNQY